MGSATDTAAVFIATCMALRFCRAEGTGDGWLWLQPLLIRGALSASFPCAAACVTADCRYLAFRFAAAYRGALVG